MVLTEVILYLVQLLQLVVGKVHPLVKEQVQVVLVSEVGKIIVLLDQLEILPQSVLHKVILEVTVFKEVDLDLVVEVVVQVVQVVMQDLDKVEMVDLEQQILLQDLQYLMLVEEEVAQKHLFLLEDQEEVHLLVVVQELLKEHVVIMQLLIQVVVQELEKLVLEQVALE